MTWHTFDVLPPSDVNVLLWRGLKDDDGGFPLVGKLKKDGDDMYIVHKPRGDFIEQDEFGEMRWTFIQIPPEAASKRARLEKRMRNG